MQLVIKRVNMRRSFSLKFKLDAVKYAEHVSGEAAAKHYKVDPKRIRSWKKQKSKLTE